MGSVLAISAHQSDWPASNGPLVLGAQSYIYCPLVSNRARHWTGIEIHPGAVIGRGLMIDHGMGVVIGETAIIGDDCQLYHGVTLGGTGKQHVKRHPTLEDGVYIGCGAKCLGNITLKKGCRIGANAVLLKDVPEGATAVGIPARIIEKK